MKRYNTPHRHRVIKTRLTEEEYAEFSERVTLCKMSQAEFIRQALILKRIAAQEQDEEQRAAQASRQREMEEWLDQQPLCFTEYDDTLTRRFVEQVTVVDAETIRVKIRDAGIEIERKLC